MITLILTIFTASAFYIKAKAMGVSIIKWTIVGILVSLIPVILIPNAVIYLTGRDDFDGLALMAAVAFVMILSATLQKTIKK